MTKKDMYLLAAQLIFKPDRDFNFAGCGALRQAYWEVNNFPLYASDPLPSLAKFFEEFFLFEPDNGGCYWFGDTYTPANQDMRLWALLLCWAMCED